MRYRNGIISKESPLDENPTPFGLFPDDCKVKELTVGPGVCTDILLPDLLNAVVGTRII